MADRTISLRVPASCRPGDQHKTEREISEIVEEYLEGIFRLQKEVDRVTTGEIATYMCVSAGSATSMIKRMAEMRLVVHQKYLGIRLTELGEKYAKQLTRAHRILEVFLVQTLDLPWNDVHELACKLEHYMGDEVIEQMYNKLGRPDKCPHGNPTDPDREDGSIRLCAAPLGQQMCVQKISDERVEFLRDLEDWKLVPGSICTVIERSNADDSAVLSIGDRRTLVGRDVGRHVWVLPVIS